MYILSKPSLGIDRKHLGDGCEKRFDAQNITIYVALCHGDMLAWRRLGLPDAYPRGVQEFRHPYDLRGGWGLKGP